MEQGTVTPYPDNYHHLCDEFKRLDLYIRHRVAVIRARETRRREILLDSRLYVSDAEVDALLSDQVDQGLDATLPQELGEIASRINALNQEITARVAASLEAGVLLTLPRLARTFGLSPFEIMTAVICLAPELRRKYEKLYVYLQDDITRKRPGIDMVADLLCESEADKWLARDVFSPVSPLISVGIVEIRDDMYGGPGLGGQARSLSLSPRFLDYVLGKNHIDEELVKTGAVKLYNPSLSMEEVMVAGEIKNRLLNIVRGHLSSPGLNNKQLVMHFYGPAGIGKRELALGLCAQLRAYMLTVDIEQWLAPGFDTRGLSRMALREGILQHALVYIDGIDMLQADDNPARSLLKSLVGDIEEFGWIVILAGENPWSAAPGLFGDAIFLSFHLEIPGFELSREAWEHALEPVVTVKDPDLAEQMARQYRLTPGQIRAAVEFAYYHDILGSAADSEPVTQLTLRHIAAAGRGQSNRKLTQLAAKIESHQGWDDIILPPAKIRTLKEICRQVTHRHQVFDQWGFGHKIARGGGLSILFTGSPGTGKTMAAGVMAKELQLDLYKIDLSGVVSKYIGETEKNLSRIFQEAETCNGILFFDEADALFGKRSEVSDAHDRYANIETSYLLQRMEEYEGIVILATNFRKNMDEAFTRRIRYIVDFPFPDEESRRRIWETHFPERAPRSEAIDYTFLARHFPISGGHIKNIVLDAAFLAAGNGRIIGMEHLLRGVRTEYEKIGKLWDENQVKQFAGGN